MSKILTNAAGNIKLELRDDRLSAWMTIQDKEKLKDEKEILDLIEEAGIKNGFEEALKYMRKHGMEKEYDTPFPVAMSNPVRGESKLSYYFDLEQARHFDGRIRPDEMAKLTSVEAGTVLADYGGNIFERQGSIYDIYGDMIREKDLDPETISAIQGENVSYDEQRQRYVADRAGYPAVDTEGRISVVSRLVLAGNISNLREGIRSQVDLEINGNVDSTSISVAGNVFINGNVCECGVYCEGNLEVDGDILSCQMPGLEVLGNIRAQSVISSRVLCRGRIGFEGGLINCEVAADGGISSREGTLCGGHIECCDDVLLGKIGDPEGTPTEIEITISPYYKSMMMRLTKEMIRLKQDPQGNADAKAELESRIKNCENSMDSELNAFLIRPPQERIRLEVGGEVFPPVQIRILKHEYKIKNHQVRLELVEKD